jgi:SPX domain protein involved in polyphosphate accumulation
MKRLATLALMVASLSGSALCQYSAEFSSYYSGKRYDFRITPEQLSSTPAWLPQVADHMVPSITTTAMSRANEGADTSGF